MDKKFLWAAAGAAVVYLLWVRPLQARCGSHDATSAPESTESPLGAPLNFVREAFQAPASSGGCGCKG